MAVIDKKRLKQYLKLNYNVLFVGPHGVGKTAVVKQVFEEEGLKWKYFSASTLDPWVDFVGIPKEVPDLERGGTVLSLVRPEYIKHDDVEAIFMDEFNRAPDKVINAMMELIQFKSINGHKMKNLRVIWAAVNPEDEDDTYSVNHLDPAHEDRFHVKITVPFKVDEDYFRKKYPQTGTTFLDWWNNPTMPKEVQKLISPRRLDYAAHAFENGCRLNDFLPRKSGITELTDMLKSLPFIDAMKKVKTETEASRFLTEGNNAFKLLDMCKKGNNEAVEFFGKYKQLMSKELIDSAKEFLTGVAGGASSITTLADLISKLPPQGDQSLAALINGVDLDSFYIGGGSLADDIKAMNSGTSKVLVVKLANRCEDILTKLSTGGSPSPLERALWGDKGRTFNSPSSLHEIVKTIARIDITHFGSRISINKRLFDNKIVQEKNFI